MKCATAIIAVAGYGTRMLPITKAIEKCMLPIGNRPVVDYVVQDCLAAGIRHIVFVVAPQSVQLKAYYDHNTALERYLRRSGKSELAAICQPPKNAHFEYVIQDVDKRYGSALPVDIARRLIPADESVLVCMGDDFVWHGDAELGTAAALMAKARDGEAAMLGVPVARHMLPRYGVLRYDDTGLFQSIVEKPDADDAPSHLINVSKYLMPPKLLDEITNYCSQPRDGEYRITDPINVWVEKGGHMHVVDNGGVYLDAGNPASWLQVNQFIASQMMQSR